LLASTTATISIILTMASLAATVAAALIALTTALRRRLLLFPLYPHPYPLPGQTLFFCPGGPTATLLNPHHYLITGQALFFKPCSSAPTGPPLSSSRPSLWLLALLYIYRSILSFLIFILHSLFFASLASIPFGPQLRFFPYLYTDFYPPRLATQHFSINCCLISED
jgi:hypothetical protein